MRCGFIRAVLAGCVLSFISLSWISPSWATDSTSAYITAPIQAIQQTRQHRFAATVISKNTTQLSSEIAANILDIHVRPGDQVTKDQRLVTLDCRDSEDQLRLLKSRLAEIQASLTQSQRLATRLGTLRDRQLTDSLSAEDAQSETARQHARLTATQTEIQMAERQIERCVVKAPYDAAITAQLASIGERTAPGMPLLALQQLSDAEIEVTLPVNRFDFSNAMQAEFQLAESTYRVEFLRVSAVINAQNRSQTAWFRAPESVPIGSSGSLILTERQAFIPAQLIVSRLGQLGVFVAESADVRFHPLAGAEEGRPYPVPDELNSAELVVQGHQWLQAGTTE
ncbi:putative Co/Zn/Cd efflux system membrane fusion protein [Nitrincola lacisaponensis]|uniref:Putative Co/Zn/Cd efflux system membrane fusion protein n=1 Tax=Nitrincola lacisaponensis TaxID=267850 RepID=A0A063Y3W1_9GAMM|nr:putative Co/Zn/Cd efflux system membrane fusion protein [Nitrincola lacisaponensis]